MAGLEPAATTIDPTGLAAIVDTADATTEAAVELIVTPSTRHMSGVNWIPTWATGGHAGEERFRVVSDGAERPRRRDLRNRYSDASIIHTQAFLADHVASALTGHSAVWWDLGNENSNCTISPDPNAADRRLERMSLSIRASDPQTRITIGTHLEDLANDRPISLTPKIAGSGLST